MVHELNERGKWTIDFEKKEIVQQLTKNQIEELNKYDDEYNGYAEVVCNFSDIYDLVSFILPFGLTHKDFNRLEATYLQQHLPVEEMWMTVREYMRVNGVSRATVYNRIEAGQLESEKSGKFTMVREKN